MTNFATTMSYRSYLERLCRRYGQGEARFVFRLVCEKMFNLSWVDILCGAVENISAEESERLEATMVRLEAGEPVQYVLGKAEFFGRDFAVNPSVLIPRPETECLVQTVIEQTGKGKGENHSARTRILDIGTGSGCVAITLALEIEDCDVESWDISPLALETAHSNAALLGALNVEFVLTDALSAMNDSNLLTRRFDAIVSNPPYIRESERQSMEKNVLDYEPELALFVPDNDALLFYRSITKYAEAVLCAGGLLAFEVNRAFAMEVGELMKVHGFSDVLIAKDQFGDDRIVTGKKK